MLFGPASPPKSRRCEVSKGVMVCQATSGPSDDETSCQGGEERLKDESRGSKRMSLLTGAELYANWLNSSVRPPWTSRVSLINAVA